MQAARVRRTDGGADLKGKGRRKKKKSLEMTEKWNFEKEEWRHRAGEALAQGPDIPFGLWLGPGVVHTRTTRAATAVLTCATALIYGLFDLHDDPSAPILSSTGPAVAAINTGWTQRPTLSQPHKHICSTDLLSLRGLALHSGLLLLLEACLWWRWWGANEELITLGSCWRC